MKDQASGDADRLFGNVGNDFVDGRDSDHQHVIDCGPGTNVSSPATPATKQE